MNGVGPSDYECKTNIPTIIIESSTSTKIKRKYQEKMQKWKAHKTAQSKQLKYRHFHLSERRKENNILFPSNYLLDYYDFIIHSTFFAFSFLFLSFFVNIPE